MSTVVFWVLYLSCVKDGGTRGIAARAGVPFVDIEEAASSASTCGGSAFLFQLFAWVFHGLPFEPALSAFATILSVIGLLCLLPIAEHFLDKDT